ncbi:cobalamin-independent methionine synthase II family protein [Neomegalonema sp.]|uniref:cobalamin-independent methionine synthase II family protein n=1 Tax=Neomegalonema sp. TaxID=2039713 RepID=UPI00262A8450|nr:cobalamin-independent methionine synthase II family protein [Neomegalonema sp.]MDD2867838.1 cobalamin-independent methionine synthase II family protein [Neomegalonema sp.]
MAARPPLFSTSLMGSLPRPRAILDGLRGLRKGALTREAFDALVEAETRRALALQEDWGLDLLTSGEFGRDNYVSFVADRLSGVEMMDMGQLLDHIEDKKAFEQILTILDVPAVSIRNAICTGRLGDRGGIALPELEMMKRRANKPLKVTLPGPYLLTRSMWLAPLSGRAYADKEELGRDVVALLQQEVSRLQEAGAAVIQFDEPVLTEVIFTEGRPRSFMCAALSERKDPAEELAFAASLIAPVLAHVDGARSLAALHVCRGNWSRDESTLLSGPYTPLLDLFAEVQAPLLELEYSTPRAGELSALLEDGRFGSGTILGLGVVNPRIDHVESVEEILNRAEEALRWLPPERLMLTPDCGFATFANRPMNVEEVIGRKVSAMTEAARILRRRHG